MDEIDVMFSIIAVLEYELRLRGFEVSRPEVITDDYVTFLLTCLRAIDH